jgi:hypothetical protein
MVILVIDLMALLQMRSLFITYLTKIFEASIQSDMGNDFQLKKNLIAGYMKFVGDVDAGNIQMPDVNLDTIAMLISEKMTNFSSAKYVRKWNNKLKQNELY